jgi:hypothetical protein
MEILLGIGLIVVLAVASQVLAVRLRVPALIILLPVGFIAGALTTDVNPPAAGGGVPAAGVAGRGRDPLRRRPGAGRGEAARAHPPRGAPPHHRRGAGYVGVRRRVRWPAAGDVVRRRAHGRRDPGGVRADGGGPPAAFHPADAAPPAGTRVGGLADRPGRWHPRRGGVPRCAGEHPQGIRLPAGEFLISVAIGVAGAIIGVAVLWFCLRKLDLGEVLGTTSQLACVVGVAAACDIARDDAGLIAAVLMGWRWRTCAALTSLRAGRSSSPWCS